MRNKTELLAPSSSLKSVIAAVNSGCDAIYIGGKAFSARAFADSPDNEGLKEIIDICHLRGVKVFVTLNTLYKTGELSELLEFARFLYEAGADAFIVQDMGFLLLAKKYFPDIELHCSTQMTIHNTGAAIFFDRFGAERVVLSRELMLDEIKEITDNIHCDTECFVHGALCVCYSGRCLMSSFFGGRSGNRGRCAQPCRMEYALLKDKKVQKRGFLISPKDICTVEMTDKLIKAGIYSFKIEGRMKSPEYVAQTVSAYRAAIDGKKLKRPELDDLKQIFNRGGSFSNGYYTQYAGSDMISPSPKSSGIRIGSVVSTYNKGGKSGCVIKTDIALHCGDGIEIWNKKHDNTGSGISAEYAPGDKIKLNVYGEDGAPVYRSYSKELNDRLKVYGEKLVRQSVLKTSFYAHLGEPVRLNIYTDKKILTFEGCEPQKADKKPMTDDDIISKLTKTGGTPFIFDFEDTDIEEGIFIPVSELNRLRREACEAAEKAIISGFERKCGDIDFKPSKNPLTKPQKLTVFIEKPEMAEAVLPHRPHRIYIELNADTCEGIIKLIKKAHDMGVEIYAALPRIERNEYSKQLAPLVEKAVKSGIDGWLLRNYNSILTEKPVMYDYCFNVTNPVSADFFGNVTLSPELTCREQASISGNGRESLVYGHVVLMSTHQCPIGNSTGTKNGKYCALRGKSGYSLKDRTGAEMPIMTHCQSCTAFILNSTPLYTAHKWKDISAIGSEFLRLDFTVEDNKTIDMITKTYSDLLRGGEIPEKPDIPYTSGHFFKGVQ